MKKLIKSIYLFINRNANPIITFVCIVFLWHLFEEKLMYLFDEFILPLTSSMTFNPITNILFFVIVVFAILRMGISIINKYYVPYLILFLTIGFCFVYTKYRLSGNYDSIPPLIYVLGYTDILVILLFLFSVATIIRNFIDNKNINGRSLFIHDNAITKPEDDILEYSVCAEELAKDLKNIYEDSSFSIGIIAPWGTGKTTFLNLFGNFLDKKEFITVKFNPRHSVKADNIQEDFFNALFSALKTYDSRFSTSFKNYLKAIDIISDNKLISFLLNNNKIWDKDSEKEKINHAIKRLNKRVVVIIEDLDRLLSDEIIEVFKLIDGNASFTNMIFITAYDKYYIDKMINEIDKKAPFSDKFFNMEYKLPIRPYSKIYGYLVDQLIEKLEIREEDKEQFELPLQPFQYTLKKHLTTVRDVKRFLNMFLRQYEQLKEEIVFLDLFILYIIK